MSNLKAIKTDFLLKVDESLKFIQKINSAVQKKRVSLDNLEISTLYEVSFLKIFTEWERFLENSFIGYLMGKSTKKLKPKMITKRMSVDKAYDLIKGTKQYPDWTKVEDILTLASLFFITLNPYDSILRTTHKELSQIKIIRNAITHISKNSTESFRKLVRSELASYNINISPGEFLMQNQSASEQYLSFYSNLLKTCSLYIIRT
jgi:hypothetical protein